MKSVFDTYYLYIKLVVCNFGFTFTVSYDTDIKFHTEDGVSVILNVIKPLSVMSQKFCWGYDLIKLENSN